MLARIIRTHGVLAALTAVCMAGPPMSDEDLGQLEPETKRVALARSQAAEEAKRVVAEKLCSLPLSFEPNLGQLDPRVRFLTRAAGMSAFLTDGENVMVLSRRKYAVDRSIETKRRSWSGP